MMIAALPEWLFFVATLIFVQLSHVIGYNLGDRRRRQPGANPEAAAGALSGTTLGLLAFMLAFTFNGAASNHHVRKDLVIEEANAIRTTYQRSMALPDPYRTKIRGLLREYVDIRTNVLNLRLAYIKPLVVRSEAIQGELWSVAVELQEKNLEGRMLGMFTESLNKVFDLHFQRLNAAFKSRISSVIWIVLFSLTFITMAMMGYRIGLSGVRSNFIEIGTALAFSLVLILIIALDRPNGMLRIDQKPLVNVLSLISSGK